MSAKKEGRLLQHHPVPGAGEKLTEEDIKISWEAEQRLPTF